MTKKELEIKLFEMINNSEMIINRGNFREFYFVYDVKRVRKDKLHKIYNSDYLKPTNKKFQECDFFMKLTCYSEFISVLTNKEIDNFLNEVLNTQKDINYFFRTFLYNYYNFDCKERDIYYFDWKHHYVHLDNERFINYFKYKNPNENKTLVFDFEKFKFDICNYSYNRIVNSYRKY
ncbi:MAG TPA: hypothetical protein VFK73_06530 [Paludibacter sp.]|nr:hypothetical protein [Paludibacter sp.]